MTQAERRDNSDWHTRSRPRPSSLSAPLEIPRRLGYAICVCKWTPRREGRRTSRAAGTRSCSSWTDCHTACPLTGHDYREALAPRSRGFSSGDMAGLRL